MRVQAVLFIALMAIMVVVAAGETSLEKLKAKVSNGTAAAPCDAAKPKGPEPPRQYLDVRLPIVVNDYHPPVGGFNPTDIPDPEVDVAARKILREIQKAEAAAAAEGGKPAPPGAAVEMSTEEHKAMKQLLLDADILVRAAGKALAENGPIEEEKTKKIVKNVAKSAVKKAKAAMKKSNADKKKAKDAKKGKGKGKGKGAKDAKKPAPAPAAKDAKAAPKPAAAGAKDAKAAPKPAAAGAPAAPAPAAKPAAPATAPAAKPAAPAPAAAGAGADKGKIAKKGKKGAKGKAGKAAKDNKKAAPAAAAAEPAAPAPEAAAPPAA
jgi:hypothetical protein